MLWGLLMLFALCNAKRHVVLLREGVGAMAIQSHEEWISSLGVDPLELKGFTAPGVYGYAGELTTNQVEQLKQRPEVMAVEEDQTYAIQVYETPLPAKDNNITWESLGDLEAAMIWGDGLYQAKHNILKGRRHFRKHPIKKIYRKNRKRPHPLLPLIGKKAMASVGNFASIFTRMHYPAFSDSLVIQSTESWGLSRMSQRKMVYSLDTYIYPKTAGKGVFVYILDTGIDKSHPELSGQVESGINLIDGTVDTADDNGHGTHCSGIVAGKTFGMAKEATLIPVKILNANGQGTTEHTIMGLIYVIKEHHKKLKKEKQPKTVINMSLGGVKSSIMQEIVKRAVKQGIHVIVAGGNDSADACSYSPASIKSAITVGAIDRTDDIAIFSNTGKCVDLFAPGVEITSAYANGTTRVLSGTSMAAPYVTGLAALYLSEENRSPEELKLLIQSDAFQSDLIKIASSKLLNLRSE
ncbi:cerevisin [Nematocida homosporus]|uniref:cerevisin n=1 Tax=Nematocida homosporus TaxID=1912981 RepID=UPI00221EB89C|nr:cerevisin [Nematocida homosporus]KAI5185368.1 cerevisin [Nematocida homosporus]